MKATLRHLSSFDEEEKMDLNQINFHFSVGGVKHSNFPSLSVKNPLLGFELWKEINTFPDL